MKVTVNLPAGHYAVYCVIPRPTVPAMLTKAMLKKMTVTECAAGHRRDRSVRVIGTDFVLTQVPTPTAGVHTPSRK